MGLISMPYNRLILNELISRLSQPKQYIQVLIGPRQVGKTTLAEQIVKTVDGLVHFVSADEPSSKQPIWLSQQWEVARALFKQHNAPVLLIIDEVQKIPDWDRLIKLNWDLDKRENQLIKVLILGSSPWLIQKGLTESLAGRFELIPVTHWSFKEMQQAFNYSLDQYIYFGGYPGAAPLISDEDRWKNYIKHSLIETTISRDILLMTRIDKPALLRQLFEFSCHYSSQILSFQKMLGQLHDAGNTTTLSHYLELLNGAGLVTGLQKYSGNMVRTRASSPKLQILNTALISAQEDYSLNSALKNRDYWGRLVESAVGAHLYNEAIKHSMHLYYWREQNLEVDFILENKNKIVAIEVKSGAKKLAKNGLTKFKSIYPHTSVIQVGGEGIKLDDFFNMDLLSLF